MERDREAPHESTAEVIRLRHHPLVFLLLFVVAVFAWRLQAAYSPWLFAI